MASNEDMQDAALILVAVGVACLLGIGIAVDWLTAVVLVVVGTLVWLGYWLAIARLSADRQRVKQQRAALDVEWDALDRTRRVREVFFDARRAMHEEAQRYRPNTPEQEGQR